VNIRVRLYPATRHLDVRFRELDSSTGQRLRHQRVRSVWPEDSLRPAPAAPEVTRVQPEPPVDRGPVGRPPGRPVGEKRPSGIRRPDRSGALRGRAQGLRDRTQPLRDSQRGRAGVAGAGAQAGASTSSSSWRPGSSTRFTSTPALRWSPRWTTLRSFAVLLEGMRETDHLGLSWIVLRRKRHLAALRAYQGLMVLTRFSTPTRCCPRRPWPPPLPAT